MSTPMRLLARRDLTIAVVAGLCAAQAIIRFTSHLSGEVAWYLYAAGRLLDGAALNNEVVETSSPLGLWLAVPVAAIAAAIDVNPAIVLKAALMVLSVGSIFFSARLLAIANDVPAAARRLLLILLAALMLFLPGADFGQREHVAIVLVTPWFLLQWHRLAGRAVPVPLAGLVGLAAAAGFWLKPHFMIAFLAVEMTVVVARRDARTIVRIENLAVVIAGGAYLAALKWYAASSLVAISTLGTWAYIPFYGVPFTEVAVLLALPSALLVAAMAVGGRANDESLHLLRAILVAGGAAFLFAFAVQTGIAYQRMPALYCLALAAGAGAVQFMTWRSVSARERVGAVASGAAILLVLAVGVSRQFVDYRGGVFERALAVEAPGARSIFVASNNVDDAFPLVVEKDFVWASRFPRQWLVRYVASKLMEKGVPEDYIVRYALDAVVGDLVAFAPDVVFIAESQASLPAPPFDHVDFWLRDQRFADFWGLYESRGAKDGFAMYVRSGPPPMGAMTTQ